MLSRHYSLYSTFSSLYCWVMGKVRTVRDWWQLYFEHWLSPKSSSLQRKSFSIKQQRKIVFHQATSFVKSIVSVSGTILFMTYFCTPKGHVISVAITHGSAGGHSDNTNATEWVSAGFSQHTVSSHRWRHPVSPGLSWNQPIVSCCYVFSNEGMSCMVTAVDPLVMLNCSMRFSSTLLSSALGSWKLFSEVGFELAMLPDTEAMPTWLSGMLLWPVDCDIFWRGLEPPPAPRTLDTCVRLATIKTWCFPQFCLKIIQISITGHVSNSWIPVAESRLQFKELI